ncbi:MAG: MerR family transcriptional regulator [bacterium]|nr:MerR family transcriptional regulator [bacterium]
MAKKLYYKIGEACKILDIQPYVLRYWETEFPFLNPNKSKSGQRVYSERELDVIRRIKELLYEEGYTIAGAKKKLEAEFEEQSSNSTAREGAGQTSAAGQARPRRRQAREKTSRSASEAEPRELDRGAVEKVQKLRAGIEEALTQGRAILELLGSESP